MELSIKELKLIAEALGQLDLEYGRRDARELEARVRENITAREADTSDICGFELPDGSVAYYRI